MKREDDYAYYGADNLEHGGKAVCELKQGDKFYRNGRIVKVKWIARVYKNSYLIESSDSCNMYELDGNMIVTTIPGE